MQNLFANSFPASRWDEQKQMGNVAGEMFMTTISKNAEVYDKKRKAIFHSQVTWMRKLNHESKGTVDKAIPGAPKYF